MIFTKNDDDRKTTLEEKAIAANTLRHARITDVFCYPYDEEQHHWGFDIETPEGITYCVWVNGDLDGETTGYLQINPYKERDPQ